MAMNLFTKTYLAQSHTSGNDLPEFLICEQSEKNAEAFLSEIRQKGGNELARRVRRVGSGKE
jgi:3-hydroxyisobutyrate dehydrogenase